MKKDKIVLTIIMVIALAVFGFYQFLGYQFEMVTKDVIIGLEKLVIEWKKDSINIVDSINHSLESPDSLEVLDKEKEASIIEGF